MSTKPLETACHPVLEAAWRALDLLEQKRSFLEAGICCDVLNAVAAVQKIYYRNTRDFNADPVQERLHARLHRPECVKGFETKK